MNMPIGEYKLPGLDEYVITHTDHRAVEIEWEQFCRLHDYPSYNLEDGYKIVFKYLKKPSVNYNIILPENFGHDKPYEIVWAT